MSDRPTVLFVIGVALLAVITSDLAIVFPPVSPAGGPIQVEGLCLLEPLAPGPPTVSLHVENAGSSPVDRLVATAYDPGPFVVPFFNITPSSPLLPGSYAYTEEGHGGGSWVPGVTTLVGLAGTYSTGTTFLESVSVVTFCVHPNSAAPG